MQSRGSSKNASETYLQTRKLSLSESRNSFMACASEPPAHRDMDERLARKTVERVPPDYLCPTAVQLPRNEIVSSSRDAFRRRILESAVVFLVFGVFVSVCRRTDRRWKRE